MRQHPLKNLQACKEWQEKEKTQGLSPNLSNTQIRSTKWKSYYPNGITDQSLFPRYSSHIRGAERPPEELFLHFPAHKHRDWSPLVIHATSIHICQLLEAIAPFVQVVIVLVLVWLRGVQGAQTSSFGTISFIVKHKQRVVRGSRGVAVGRLQILKKKEENRISQWKEPRTWHLGQDAFSWCLRQSGPQGNSTTALQNAGSNQHQRGEFLPTVPQDGHDTLSMKRKLRENMQNIFPP